MKKIQRCIIYFSTAVIIFSMMNCSSIKIVSAPEKILKKYQTVAVVPLKIEIKTRDSQIVKVVNTVIASEKDKKARKFLQAVFSKDRDELSRFQDYLTAALNRNFLKKGYVPIERSRIKTLFKEIGLQQVGAIDPAKAKQFGKLASADALFIGKILIEIEKRLVFNKIKIYFSGRLVSVQEGYVLIIGNKSTEARNLKLEVFSELIDSWFRSVSPKK